MRSAASPSRSLSSNCAGDRNRSAVVERRVCGLEPVCPDHPDTHPLTPLATKAGLVWACPVASAQSARWGRSGPPRSACPSRPRALVTEAINEHLRPLRQRRAELAAEPAHLIDVLRAGNARANHIADATLTRVRQVMDIPTNRPGTGSSAGQQHRERAVNRADHLEAAGR